MFLDKLAALDSRYEEILSLLSAKEVIEDRNQFQKLGKELSDLEDIVKVYRHYKQNDKAIEEAQAMLSDPELKELATAELSELTQKREELKQNLEFLLIPKDPLDDKNIIVEIRGGTGGEEAALFA